MFDIVILAAPAAMVSAIAALLVRRERAERVVDRSGWDDRAEIPAVDLSDTPRPRRSVTGGALVEPCGSSLGARLRQHAPAEVECRGRVRVRARTRPLTATRADG